MARASVILFEYCLPSCPNEFKIVVVDQFFLYSMYEERMLFMTLYTLEKKISVSLIVLHKETVCRSLNSGQTVNDWLLSVEMSRWMDRISRLRFMYKRTVKLRDASTLFFDRCRTEKYFPLLFFISLC